MITNIEDFKEDEALYKLLLEAREAMKEKEALKLSIILTRLKLDHNVKLEADDNQVLENTVQSSISTVQ